MAKKSNPKREARIEKNNRNLNRALSLFSIGFFAEFYLLLINRYYVKGTIPQLVAVYDFLQVVIYIGCALVAAGVVSLIMREKWPRFAPYSPWLLGLGVFFVLSSELMRKVYPTGTTIMCMLVPVLMLLSVVFLLYQREFAVQTLALTAALAFAVVLNRTIATPLFVLIIRVGAYLSLISLAAAAVALFMAQKKGGMLGKLQLFPEKGDYALTYAVLAFAFISIAVSLFAGFAYYAIWAGAVLLFGLAVWYTVKML